MTPDSSSQQQAAEEKPRREETERQSRLAWELAYLRKHIGRNRDRSKDKGPVMEFQPHSFLPETLAIFRAEDWPPPKVKMPKAFQHLEEVNEED